METNKLYECTVIIDGGLQDEAILAAMELVKRVITEKGGTISNVLEIGRRKTECGLILDDGLFLPIFLR